MDRPTVSLIVATNGRVRRLERMLESVVRMKGLDKAEVVILINGESGATEALVKRFALLHRNIRYLRYPGLTRGEARNRLLAEARGAILYFLDDDIQVCPDNITMLLAGFEKHSHADIIGGPNLTPPDSNSFETAQGLALGSRFGAFHISQRYTRAGRDRAADDGALILCNLAIKKEVFKESGILFSSKVVCGEENVLLQRLMRLDYKAMFLPEFIVYHDRRDTYFDFFKQIFVYGRGRCQIIKCIPSMKALLHVIPGLFLLYLLLMPSFANKVYMIPLYSYVLADVLSSGAIARRERKNVFWLLLVLYPTIHIAYGLGFLVELLHLKYERRQAEKAG